jgi:sterol 3beta-glucosyltransferase
MKVTMLAIGSRGDVQPYIALGLGLQSAGYDVLLATHSNFEDFVTAHGLRFHNLGGDVRAIMETPTGRALVATGTNPFPFIRYLKTYFEQTSDEFLDSSLQACEGAGAIIYSIFAITAYHIAEKMRIPCFPALLQPFTRTSAFPIQPPVTTWMRSGPYNRLTFLVAQQAFGQTFKPVMNRWRNKLGLPPLPFAGLYSLIDRRRLPVLYGYSPTVVPKPRDWGPQAHVTGYWFLDRPPNWQPPSDLTAFLQAGEPPVYVGFGSMATLNPEQTADIIITAIRKANRRGVLLSGWGGLSPSALPEDICLVDSVPHDWLFPQMAAIIHHGGAGTTGAGVRSGVPSLAIPFFADQYFWADRLSHLGVGPTPIPQNQLTADTLTHAIRTATNQPIKRRAATIGHRVQSENGVARAVQAIRNRVRE